MVVHEISSSSLFIMLLSNVEYQNELSNTNDIQEYVLYGLEIKHIRTIEHIYVDDNNNDLVYKRSNDRLEMYFAMS